MKTGPKPRPAASIRSETLTLKVTKLEKAQIHARTRQLGVSFADYCREFLLDDVDA